MKGTYQVVAWAGKERLHYAEVPFYRIMTLIQDLLGRGARQIEITLNEEVVRG